MTSKQIYALYSKASEYNSPDAFVSDAGQEFDAGTIDQLRTLWHIANDSFRDFLDVIGLTQLECSNRFCIPFRTVRGWACGMHASPSYIRLMMAELTGIINLEREDKKMTIDKMIKDYGKVNYDGKTYVLTQQAYIDGFIDAPPYYTATAICPEDGVDEDGLYDVYDITWYPTQEWLDSDRDDEGWACDWDAPENVRKTNLGYDLADDSVVY